MTDGSARAVEVGAPGEGARFGRILLKLSGEALLGSRQYGVDPEKCVFIAEQVRAAVDRGVQVAGMAPQYVTIDSIPTEALEAKKAELLADEATQNKPEEIRERIVEGQLNKWYKEVVLYEQTFRDTEITVGELVTEAVARIGENIKVRRFVRYQLGEAL